MSILVAYYSRSGMTRAVAAAVARRLGADLEAIRCQRYRRGSAGGLRAGYDSWRGNLPPIEAAEHPPSNYDLVVIAGPIWVSHPATPLRAFLRREAARLPSVAFLLTHGGSPPEGAFREMEALAGRAPVATLVVRDAEVKADKIPAAIASFTAALREKQAA